MFASIFVVSMLVCLLVCLLIYFARPVGLTALFGSRHLAANQRNQPGLKFNSAHQNDCLTSAERHLAVILGVKITEVNLSC